MTKIVATPMKAIAYTRVSTLLQAKYGGGLDTQKESIAQWAAEHGHEIVAWETDEGESGKNGLDTRVGLARALSLLEAGVGELLVVDYMDRLARDLLMQETMIVRLRAAGVEVVSVKEPTIEGDEALRDMMRQILGAFAQYDRAKTRGRMLAGARRKHAEGGYAWGRPPYGFRAKDGALVPVPDEQKVVAEILRLRQGGMTFGAIVDHLNLAGCRRPGGGIWRMEQVRRVVNRQRQAEGPKSA